MASVLWYAYCHEARLPLHDGRKRTNLASTVAGGAELANMMRGFYLCNRAQFGLSGEPKIIVGTQLNPPIRLADRLQFQVTRGGEQ
jgi:hypothetical protein